MGRQPDLVITLGTLDLTAAMANGTRFMVESFDGWGSPASDIVVVKRPGSVGGWAGPATLAPRPLSLGGKINAPTIELLATSVDALISATTVEDTTLTVAEGTDVRSMTVRRDGDVLIEWLTASIAKWSIQLVALDPRKTIADVTGSTGLPSATGGWSIPWTIPWSIPSTVTAGQVTLTNPGNIAGKMTVRIDGPVTAPRITHVTSGKVLVFASSMSLSAGEWLIVDFDAKTALANGTASRNGWITSREWPTFEPGINVIAVSAAAHSDALFTVTGTPSWA